jgi:hypothetical protein
MQDVTKFLALSLPCLCSQRGLHFRINLILLCASLTMYAMSTAAWAGHLHVLWQDINIALSPLLSDAVDAGAVPLAAAQYSIDAPYVLLHVCTNVVNVSRIVFVDE